MSVFRLTFDDGQEFDIDVRSRGVGRSESVVTAAVYRYVDGQRDSKPIRTADGERLVFAASTEEEAVELACTMVKSMHKGLLKSLGRATMPSQ
jgi:hypothetical protein